MADKAKWWQVYGTTPNQKEKANALYSAAAYMPYKGLKNPTPVGEASRAADEQEKRGIIRNRVNTRNKKKDASGVGRHGVPTILGGGL